MDFSTLGLDPALLRAVAESGYTSPTSIQSQAIPAILDGRDVMAAAQTGTGKTAGFTLPMLQLLAGQPIRQEKHVRALVLTPTRELAAQVEESIRTYGKYTAVRSVVVFGGVNINPQVKALRQGAEILVATPGRLLDLYQQKAVSFESLQMLVLDEADRMLDMGFIRDIRKILALLPRQRQNLMFSATFSAEIRELAKTICRNPQEIDVAPRNSTVEKIEQQVYRIEKDKKLALLAKLIMETPDQILVFSRTKHGANNLVKKLAAFRIQAAAIHGNKSQSQRTKALADFKEDRIQVLVATDIAARGIDIEQLAMVINFDLPQVPEDYVHRIGRTGRAGASGQAVSLVTEEDHKQLRQIERLIKLKIPQLPVDYANLPVATRDTDAEKPAPAAREGAPVAREAQSGKTGRRRQGAGGRNQNVENRQARAGSSGESRRRRSKGNTAEASAAKANGQQPRHPEARTEQVSDAPRKRRSRNRSRNRRSGEQAAQTATADNSAGNKARKGLWSSLKQGLGQLVKGAA
jgi:ATP-dependent RNA helicase RhlE